MIILKQNIKGKKIEFIEINDIYISVTDYKQKKILIKIDIQPGMSTWVWQVMGNARKSHNVDIDINPLHYENCSFDKAINREINDVYSTVYQFEKYEDMIKNWKNIKYVDVDRTIYKEQDKNEKK